MRDLKRHLHPSHPWDLLVTSDPALGWLRPGMRAVLSAGVAALLLSRMTRWLDEPPTVTMVGTMVAMMGSQLATEPEPRAQRHTTLLMVLPDMASLVVGTIALRPPCSARGRSSGSPR